MSSVTSSSRSSPPSQRTSLPDSPAVTASTRSMASATDLRWLMTATIRPLSACRPRASSASDNAFASREPKPSSRNSDSRRPPPRPASSTSPRASARLARNVSPPESVLTPRGRPVSAVYDLEGFGEAVPVARHRAENFRGDGQEGLLLAGDDVGDELGVREKPGEFVQRFDQPLSLLDPLREFGCARDLLGSRPDLVGCAAEVGGDVDDGLL